MNYKLLSFICLVLLGCNQSTPEQASEDINVMVTGPFMNMEPTTKPKLLAPELLASSLDEYNGTFSPDGKTFYFTTDAPTKGIICYAQMEEDGRWRTVRTAAFSSDHTEYDPLYAPDGTLYFSSRRSVLGDSIRGRSRIWKMEDGAPVSLKLDQSIDAYYSSLTSNGIMYYNTWSTGDLWRARLGDNHLTSERLPDHVRMSRGAGDPFISPDEDYLIFRGYDNSLGHGDLYISYRQDGEWSEPINLGRPINSAYHEMCPWVTPDGKFLVFASNRQVQDYKFPPNEDLETIRKKHQTSDNGEQNIYYISADFIEEMRTE